MSQHLFDSFSTNTKKQWQNQAIKDLKGKDFDETLLWHTPEQITIEPFYAVEDLEQIQIQAIQFAQNNKENLGWQNRPIIKFSDEKETNKLIISTLQKGVSEILLDFSGIDILKVNVVKVLDKIKLSDTPIIFKTNNQSQELAKQLLQFVHYKMKGGIQEDALADWMTKGNPLNDSWKNTNNLVNLLHYSEKFKCISVGSHHFHNAGANAIQELAFTLASAVTYIDKLSDEGLNFANIISRMEFSISIGTNYFMEIAKIRALRFLWEKCISGFAQLPNSEGLKLTGYDLRLNAQTSTFYDAAITPNTNMLRATTEAMSAVIGGCDSLTVHAYDAVFRESDEFSERIARNISILLKEEAHFDKTNDASAGSYYIENLTNQLVNSAWALFLKIENMGGIIPAFESEFVQSEIENAFNTKVESLQNGKIMVGVNKFRFDEEALQLFNNQDVKNNSNLKLLPNRRLSQVFEK